MAYFDLEGMKKIGTPMKISRHTKLGHLPDPKCHKCGPRRVKKEPKLALKSLLTKKHGPGGLFWVARGERGWNTNEDIQAD